VLVILAIYVIIFLIELEKIRFVPSIMGEPSFLIETVAVVLMLVVAVLFTYVHNIMTVVIQSDGGRLENVLVSYKYTFFSDGQALESQHAHTSDKWSMIWGPGYILFTLATIFAFLLYLDRYLLRGALDLSNYWRFRGHIAILTYLLLAFPISEAIISDSFHTWSPLIHITYFGQGFYIEKTVNGFMIMTIFVTLQFVVFLLGVMVLPSRHVMKAQPFITLALPDEEILRRHKMLPVVTRWKKIVDWLLSILAFLALAFFYIGLLRELGSLAIFIYYKGRIGLFWTTPTAYILTLAMMIQSAIILKPTK